MMILLFCLQTSSLGEDHVHAWLSSITAISGDADGYDMRAGLFRAACGGAVTFTACRKCFAFFAINFHQWLLRETVKSH